MKSIHIQSESDYQNAVAKWKKSPDDFWADIANAYTWLKPWNKVVEADFPKADFKWFLGGKLNITLNALDRHVEAHPDKTAILWEPNNPKDPHLEISYKDLLKRVSKMAHAMKAQGIEKGDRVCLYMPMIPELAVAVLACARIGAVHSVVFAGFSAQSLADRIQDSHCKLVITSDELKRGGKIVGIKNIVDQALESCPSVTSVLVAQSTGASIPMQNGRDHWLEEVQKNQADFIEAEEMDSEDPLFILYTSGSTGKPKGVVHTCGGYMVYAGYSFLNVFQVGKEDVYWCTADIGWITGHTYIVYGPLLAGATTTMFEGVPTWPDAGRFWAICEKHKINQFYTAPTAIRALMAKGDEFVDAYPLKDLKVIGSVGEPINEEAWVWYHEKVGKKNCPVVDTWWQTETGGIMISALGDVGPQKPTFAGRPLPGVDPILVDNEGNLIEENNQEGLLCIRSPWPSMIRTTYGDHQRCINTYFSAYKGYYFTGDGAKRDADGHYRIIGRVDDVINVSGHRFGTAEIENAIDEHPEVVESAVVGFPHDIKGQGIYAYVILSKKPENQERLREEIQSELVKAIGPIAKPDAIQFVSGLPKTRSGKIMRRILRKVASGESDQLGDTSTLLDPEVVEEIISGSKHFVS